MREDERSFFIKEKYIHKRWAKIRMEDPVTIFIKSHYSLKTSELLLKYQNDNPANENHAITLVQDLKVKE